MDPGKSVMLERDSEHTIPNMDAALVRSMIDSTMSGRPKITLSMLWSCGWLQHLEAESRTYLLRDAEVQRGLCRTATGQAEASAHA